MSLNFNESQTTYTKLFQDTVSFYKNESTISQIGSFNWSNQSGSFTWSDNIGVREYFWFTFFTLTWFIFGQVFLFYIFPNVALVKMFKLPEYREKYLALNLLEFLGLVLLNAIIYKYVAIDHDHDFIATPLRVWDDYNVGSNLTERDFYSYSIMTGYFFNSVLFMCKYDRQNKDFIPLIAHHVLTSAGICVGYVLRFHHLTMLSIVFMKVSSLPQSIRRILVSFQNHNKPSLLLFKTEMALLAFYVFFWFWLRLYLYPLKVMFASIALPYKTDLEYSICKVKHTILILFLFINISFQVNITRSFYNQLHRHFNGTAGCKQKELNNKNK